MTKDSKYSKVYFVTMNNVFETSRQIDVRYDLKGSLHQRETKTMVSCSDAGSTSGTQRH